MRVSITGTEPEHIKAMGCEPADVIKNTKDSLMIVTDVDDNYVYFAVVSQDRRTIDKMYGYGRRHVDHMLKKGNYNFVGRAKLPEVYIEFFE